MMNTTLEIFPSPEGIPHDLIEKQTNNVTLLRRHFSRCQLEVSRGANGRLRGWVTVDETREVKLKGLPTYLNFKRATQLLKQSYLKFQKGAIEVLPKGLGGGAKQSHSSFAIESNKAETCEEGVLQLVEAISDNEEKRIVRKVVEGLLKNDSKEKDLNLAINRIGDAGAQALGTALQVNQSVQSLHLEYNQIGNAGAQALSTALQINQSIQLLNLSHNQVGNIGAQAIAATLHVNQSLWSLNLVGNRIGDTGAQALGTALQVNQPIQTLNLANNVIGTKGAEALANALKINHTLQLLNLYKNLIGDDGAQAIGTALQVNHTLQLLNLYNNLIYAAGAQALGASLKVNQTIQTLNLGNNAIGAEGIITEKRIQTLLEANKQIATLFQQQITQVQRFLQSHENDDGILLEHLPQLKELLSKWYTDSNDLIPFLQEILRNSGRTNLNDRYRKKLERIIKELTNRLHDLWLEPFEQKVATLSNEYIMSKESSEERNVDLGYALYDTWLAFVGSDCPSWVEDHLQSLVPFSVLLDIAEAGGKQDITDLTDAHSLFQRVLSFGNESQDSLFSLTNQS